MRPTVVFAVLLLVLTGLAACVNDPAEVAAFERKFSDKIEVAENVRVVYSDSGFVRGIVTAPTMLNYLDKGDERQEFPDGLRVYFLDQFQDTTSTLDAKWGLYRRREKTITVRDSVIWQSVDQQRLDTEELIWEERTERIHTNKFVILRQPDYIITGYGLEADQSFENARVLQVTGRIPVKRPREEQR